MIADPRTDEISISFGKLNTFVRFPMEDISKGVVFNSLRNSKFNEAIEPFISGIVEATGMDPRKKGVNELLKAVGGAVRSIGLGKKKAKAQT